MVRVMDPLPVAFWLIVTVDPEIAVIYELAGIFELPVRVWPTNKPLVLETEVMFGEPLAAVPVGVKLGATVMATFEPLADAFWLMVTVEPEIPVI